MALLFIDSTYDLTLGLLDDGFSWLALQSYPGQKGSSVLQLETHRHCREQGISPRELKAIITVAGPGFYTGLRLSEGFADIFKMFGIPHYSFYSYELPRWLGEKKGRWLTKAYRGEYFIHHWDGEVDRNELVSAKELPAALANDGKVFIHSQSAIDELIKSQSKDFTLTMDLLKESPGNVFQQVLKEKITRESFYFRAPEDEFRVAT